MIHENDCMLSELKTNKTTKQINAAFYIICKYSVNYLNQCIKMQPTTFGFIKTAEERRNSFSTDLGTVGTTINLIVVSGEMSARQIH